VVVYANYIGLCWFYRCVVNISRWSPYEGGQLDRFYCTSKTVRTFHERSSLHFTPLHTTSHHFTSLQFIPLHSISLHFISLHFSLHHISLQFISLHFTSLHFTAFHITSHHSTSLHSTSLFFTSLQFWTFRHYPSKTLHFSSLIITFLTFFLKTCDLEGKVAKRSTGVHLLSCTKYMNICCHDCGSVCFRNVLCREVKLYYNDVICIRTVDCAPFEGNWTDTEAADGLCDAGRGSTRCRRMNGTYIDVVCALRTHNCYNFVKY